MLEARQLVDAKVETVSLVLNPLTDNYVVISLQRVI